MTQDRCPGLRVGGANVLERRLAHIKGGDGRLWLAVLTVVEAVLEFTGRELIAGGNSCVNHGRHGPRQSSAGRRCCY